MTSTIKIILYLSEMNYYKSIIFIIRNKIQHFKIVIGHFYITNSNW